MSKEIDIKQPGIHAHVSDQALQSVNAPIEDFDDYFIKLLSEEICKEIDQDVIDEIDPEGAVYRKIERKIEDFTKKLKE
jgi:hypothetical protein